MPDSAIRKDQERKIAGKRRKELHLANPAAGEAITRHVMDAADALGLGAGPRTVSAFCSMGTEISTVPLLAALGAAGHKTALPVVERKNAPLVFRAWAAGDPLVDGGFGTSVPAPDAAPVTPDVVFVPLLAFDDDGYRLGYGGGFYDRTLEKLRAEGEHVIAIGIAFSGQRVETVPRDSFDQPLDWIATEVGLMRIEAKGKS
ncbi:MAG: 5-formyltetrahydrofolate cyclo-ligase [Rhodospirillales bacterium]|nr:5-formyltetrahydrofolate cyclo-ligase [Rhodospirillales bacterium]MBO6787475.1 5-formyltetrahydrofolate cyclo-ligase [Rhodospirillales bacterium]